MAFPTALQIAANKRWVTRLVPCERLLSDLWTDGNSKKVYQAAIAELAERVRQAWSICRPEASKSVTWLAAESPQSGVKGK